jgi:tRNA(Ile)-lysidine synthase
MEQSIHKLIQRASLLQKKDRVLVAVSGGPDSMALLHWLIAHQGLWELELMAVHLNHGFRGAEADADQVYVETVCASWDVPCLTKKLDVNRYAKENQLSKQVAARECRYSFFDEVAEGYHMNKLAMAHHGDDQIETVLMRLVRGAGLSGLSGIPVQRQTSQYTIIRPLMGVSKAQVEEYCRQMKIEPRLDQSNLKDDYIRNKLRHHVLPYLQELNPNIHQVIHEVTETLREEDSFLEDLAEKSLKQVIESESWNRISMNLPIFQTIALPLQRRVILLILNYLIQSHSHWSKVHIDLIIQLIRTEYGSKQIHLPHGITVVREYDHVYILKDYMPSHQKDSYEYVIDKEGEIHLADHSIRMMIEINERNNSAYHEKRPEKLDKETNGYALRRTDVAHFDAQTVSFPLVLRTRKPGDRIQPLGMEGYKKVKDIFIDEKVPPIERTQWPLLADQEGILWIPGLKRANRGKVVEATTEIMTISFITDKLREGNSC